MESPHRNEPVTDPKQPQYDPPRVEEVLSSEDLDREVHYAGAVGISERTPG